VAVLVVIAFVLVGAMINVAQALSDQYPRGRTSPRQRLLRNNPALARHDVRWSVAARRVRTGWLTALTVCIALYVAFQRPTVATTNDAR
jgi:hypothetical protein